MFFSWTKRPSTIDDALRYELPPEDSVGNYVPPATLKPVVLVERRAHPRHPFPYHQRIAESADRSVPRRVRSLRCHDLSRAGFSFWSDRAPASPTLLVDLGIGDEMMRVSARVCHATAISAAPATLWLVGCRVEACSG